MPAGHDAMQPAGRLSLLFLRQQARKLQEHQQQLGLACNRLLQLGAGALLQGDGQGHDNRHVRVHVHRVHAALLCREHVQMPVCLHPAGSNGQSGSAHHSGQLCAVSRPIPAWLQSGTT